MSLVDAIATSPSVTLLFKVTIILTVAWLLYYFMRSANPRWQVGLWRTTLVIVIALPLAERLVPNWQFEIPTKNEARVNSSRNGENTEITLDFDAKSQPITEHLTAQASLEVSSKPNTNSAESPKSSTDAKLLRPAWPSLVFFIWLSIAGALFLRLIRKLLDVRKLVRASNNAPRELVELARKAMPDSGLRKLPDIRVSRDCSAPFAAGTLAPVVVVPSSLIDEISTQELEAILTHELGHISGRDIAWTICALVVKNILWFHPLVWRIPLAHQLACETVCDALACGNSRNFYRRTLAKLALQAHRQEISDTAVVMSATAEITRRLRRLAEHIPVQRIPLNRRLTAIAFGSAGTVIIAALSFVPVAFANDSAEVLAAKESPTTVDDTKDESKWTIQFRAVDADTGKPIANPEFAVQLGKTETKYAGNKNGELSIELPSRTPRYCYLKVSAGGYTPMRGFWGKLTPDQNDPLPESLTFKMTPGIAAGGIVLDEDGQPVEGATVLFSAGARQPEQRLEKTFWKRKYITNDQGRWECDIAPRDMNSGSINVNHPDYAKVTSSWSIDQSIAELQSKEYTWTLKTGFTIRGMVTNPAGAPIAGAHLAVGSLNLYSPEGPFAVTDSQGRFEFQRIRSANQSDNADEPYQMSVTVLAAGWAPQIAVVPGTGERELEESTWSDREMNFQLDKGKTLTLQLTDKQGNPVEDAWVFPSEWRYGTNGLTVLREHGIPENSDETGVWQWPTAPIDQEVSYDILKRGFMDIRGQKFSAGKKHSVTLRRPQILLGKVVDARTKQPIDEFVIQKGFEGMSSRDYPEGVWWTSNTQERNGKFRRLVSMPKDSYRWRFVAEGYESYSTNSIPVTEGEHVLNVELVRREE